MIYLTDLENKVFDNTKNADELIILTGYIGLDPILKTEILPYDTKVIYGMYEDRGIAKTLHESVKRVNNTLAKTNVFYSNNLVHSKCYIWRKRNVIVEALTGSANFTVPGLSTPYREILTDVTNDSFNLLNQYAEDVINNSKNCCDIKDNELKINDFIKPQFLTTKISNPSLEMVCEASLLGRGDEVPEMSAINWGLANGKVSEGDASITITKNMIEKYPFLFPPKQMKVTKETDGGKSNRQNDYIEIIWDDGVLMKGLLEGTQEINGITYPNKISSFPRKNIMGKYIRDRLHVDLNHTITKKDLELYGRTSITISMVGDGIYSMDFSVKH